MLGGVTPFQYTYMELSAMVEPLQHHLLTNQPTNHPTNHPSIHPSIHPTNNRVITMDKPHVVKTQNRAGFSYRENQSGCKQRAGPRPPFPLTVVEWCLGTSCDATPPGLDVAPNFPGSCRPLLACVWLARPVWCRFSCRGGSVSRCC